MLRAAGNFGAIFAINMNTMLTIKAISGLLGGGTLGYGYHLFMVQSAKNCASCDTSLTPMFFGAAIGLAIMIGSKS